MDKIADTLISRENRLGRSLKIINVESGLGASGIPHIGSMGDAVRAYGIGLALKNRGYDFQLIAYSDDMDGLRKIPQGFPSWLSEYVAMPVSKIPDPFGSCHKSYGQHMSNLLLEGLDRVGINYNFKSAADVYSSGLLSKQADLILSNNNKVGEKIAKLVGQEKYNETLPYFPICSVCKRLYVAVAQEYFPEEKKIKYICKGSTVGNKEIKGCGHTGESDIRSGEGKLAWKVEFAARWKALDIRFEAYGKDIMDSVRVNDWVCDSILGFSHPLHIKYEMFLDKGGKKISKSSGNVLTPQMWLKYGTPQSLLLLLYKRIAGTRHISIEDVPDLMDEYDYFEDIYFDRIKENNQAKLIKIKGIYEYINKLEIPNTSKIHVPYRILIQQASLFTNDDDRTNKIINRLIKYGLVKRNIIDDDLIKKIKLAINWADETEAENIHEITITTSEKKALIELVNILKEYDLKEDLEDTAKGIQTSIFEIARKNNMEPREFFKLLYRILINNDRGPKLGNYFIDLGIERTRKMILKHIE